MKHSLKIGESQIPQICCFVVGLLMVFAFEIDDNGLYALLSLFATQLGVIFMGCYDEREDEKKADAEAFAMLDKD